MKTSASSPAGFKFDRRARFIGAFFALLLLSGCPVTVPVKTTSPDVTITVLQPQAGSAKQTGPGAFELVVNDAAKPVRLRMSRPGYFSHEFDYYQGKTNLTVEELSLKLATLPKSFLVTTSPEGATITLDGAPPAKHLRS